MLNARETKQETAEKFRRKSSQERPSGERPGAEEATKSSEGGRAGEDEVLQF